jgi:hypothetical protein
MCRMCVCVCVSVCVCVCGVWRSVEAALKGWTAVHTGLATRRPDTRTPRTLTLSGQVWWDTMLSEGTAANVALPSATRAAGVVV